MSNDCLTLKNKKMMEREPKTTLLQTYDQDLQHFKVRVGIDRALSTYKGLLQGRKYVADYLATQLQRPDIALAELSFPFIEGFADWLSTHRRLRSGTVWLACQQLKGVVSRAFLRGQLSRNPFSSFHIAKNIRQREYLTESELRLLMTCQPAKAQLAFARDIFVFAALTGLSFVDIKALTPQSVITIDGKAWIAGRRRKTNVPYIARLLPKSLEIIARYHRDDGGPLFGQLQYRTLAKQVKQLMQACHISRPITLHCARHTFAVLALDKGMPIESVSRILGHTHITTTQIYARVTTRKLSADFDTFEQCVSMP